MPSSAQPATRSLDDPKEALLAPVARGRYESGGGSYGGYLAALLLGRPHPFRTLIAHAGVYNLYTQYGSDGGAQSRRFGEFWDPKQDALYRKMSPHFGAANFNTPTLVIHGALDYRVPDNHGIELFNALQNRGARAATRKRRRCSERSRPA